MIDVSSTKENGAIAVVAGQLLIYCLKCDEHDLILLKRDLSIYICENANVKSLDEQFQIIRKGIHIIITIIGQRHSLKNEAVELLIEKLEAVFRALFSREDFTSELAKLKVIDAWSGISGALRGNTVPVSLLDYIIEIILPLMAAKEIKKGSKIISTVLDDNVTEASLDEIDNILNDITKKICFGCCFEKNKNDGLKLAALANFPQISSAFSMKLGFTFKLLQARYSKMEVHNG